MNKENGIIINGFSKDEPEADLLVIIPFLVFLSQQKTIRPIYSLYKKYLDMTLCHTNAFKVIANENQLPIQIIEENTESLKSGLGSQEQYEDEDTTPDDVDRSISNESIRLKGSKQLMYLKEKIKQSHFKVLNLP